MNSSLIVVFLCAFAFATINALPSDNKVEGKSIVNAEGIDGTENYKFGVQPRNNNDNLTRAVCGWAANPSACSYGCGALGWPKYTFWFASGDCCCHT